MFYVYLCIQALSLGWSHAAGYLRSGWLLCRSVHLWLALLLPTWDEWSVDGFVSITWRWIWNDWDVLRGFCCWWLWFGHLRFEDGIDMVFVLSAMYTWDVCRGGDWVLSKLWIVVDEGSLLHFTIPGNCMLRSKIGGMQGRHGKNCMVIPPTGVQQVKEKAELFTRTPGCV